MPRTGTSRFEARDRASQRAVAAVERHGAALEREVTRLEHREDHPVETEPLPVLGREDASDPVRVQRFDLRRDDDAASAAVDLDVSVPLVAEAVDEIPEVFDVPTLVGAHRDAVRVLLDDRRHHFVDRTVVAEVHDLRAVALEQPPHDVDRRVVTVEEARSRDKSQGHY
jgi:hypothetical protein